jgi:hypothetical protein
MKRCAELEEAIDAQPTPSSRKSSSENARESAPRERAVRSDGHSNKVAPQNYGAISPNADEGLNQIELCEFYGLSWRNLKRNMAIAGFSDVIDYFAVMTGIRWESREAAGRSKRYAPIEPLQND